MPAHTLPAIAKLAAIMVALAAPALASEPPRRLLLGASAPGRRLSGFCYGCHAWPRPACCNGGNALQEASVGAITGLATGTCYDERYGVNRSPGSVIPCCPNRQAPCPTATNPQTGAARCDSGASWSTVWGQCYSSLPIANPVTGGAMSASFTAYGGGQRG